MVKKISFGLLAIWIMAAAAFAMPSFSCDWVVSSAGRDTGTAAKLFWTPQKWRSEMSMGKDFTMIMIARTDINKLWTINSVNRTYTESTLDFMRTPTVGGKYPGEVSRRQVGREAVSGIMCNKFEISYKFRGETKKAYQWISVDNQIGVKTADAAGAWSSEMRNLKVGAQPASLFDIPAGYKRVAIPKIKF